MGIQLEKEIPQGYKFNYWKIAGINISIPAGKSEIVLFGYKDKSFSDTNRPHIFEDKIVLNNDKILDGDIRKNCYKLIMQMENFKGAKKL